MTENIQNMTLKKLNMTKNVPFIQETDLNDLENEQHL